MFHYLIPCCILSSMYKYVPWFLRGSSHGFVLVRFSCHVFFMFLVLVLFNGLCSLRIVFFTFFVRVCITIIVWRSFFAMWFAELRWRVTLDVVLCYHVMPLPLLFFFIITSKYLFIFIYFMCPPAGGQFFLCCCCCEDDVEVDA